MPPLRQRLSFAAIALGVVMAHAAILSALPPVTLGASRPAPETAGETVWTFETRTLPVTTAPAPQLRPTPQKPRAAALPQRPQAAPDTAIVDEASNSTAPMDTALPTEDVVQTAAATASAAAQENAPPPKADLPAHTARKTPLRVSVPASVRLKYDVRGEIKGFSYFVNGDLTWITDGKTYSAQLAISHFLLGSRTQTSKGLVTEWGLEPVRFGDKVRSEVAAHFDRGNHKISYSANTPDEPLTNDAQDQLSVFFQIAGVLASSPSHHEPGSVLKYQTVGPKHSEVWEFVVGAPEVLTLPGGKVSTLQVTKKPVSEYDSRAEVWLAPELDYLPVRIRLTQGNGDVVDQLWRATERPTSTP